MTSSNLETNRFEGARRSKPAALQLLFVLHRRASPLLFLSVNALNVTTKTWGFDVAITTRDSNLLPCLCCRCDRLLAVAEDGELAPRRVLKLSARTRFAPKRLATAPSSIARSPLAFRLARRTPGRALVALRRPGHGAVFFDPGRGRRHGLAQRRDRWRGCVHIRRKYPQWPGFPNPHPTALCRRRFIPAAGYSDSGLASCLQSISLRRASSEHSRRRRSEPSSLEARTASGRVRPLWPQLSPRRKPRLRHTRNTRANH
jgi:hypothetical protein